MRHRSIYATAVALGLCTLWGMAAHTQADEEAVAKDMPMQRVREGLVADSDLTVTIAVPMAPLKEGATVEVTMGIRNSGSVKEIVYMPGLTARVNSFVPANPLRQTPARPDQYGLPMVYARPVDPDERANFVTLEPGDSYARTIHSEPLVAGEYIFSVVYENRRAGLAADTILWRGKSDPVHSAPVVVTAK